MERFSLEPTVFDKSNFSKPRRSFFQCDEKYSLLRKGNEGLAALDPHTCFICRRVLSTRYSYRMHLQNFHRQTTKLFCDLCPKFYFSREAMLRHIRNAHCGKRFCCNVCDYKAANKTQLKYHKLIHADKVECTICKQPVTSLKGHMKTHTLKGRCSICQKLFSARNLTTHMKMHTRVRKCGSCNEKFDYKEDLRRFVKQIKGLLFFIYFLF